MKEEKNAVVFAPLLTNFERKSTALAGLFTFLESHKILFDKFDVV